jgi:hypothetical protein
VERPARQLAFGSRRGVFLSAALGSISLAAVGLLLATPGPLHYSRLDDRVLAEEAAVQALVEARAQGLRSGVCHFNERGRHKVFADFLAAWDCWGSATPRGMVVGDSHAADVVVALRSAGLDVGQMTGAGCSLVPALMSGACRRQFDHIRQQAEAQNLRVLSLANRFDPAELTDAALEDMARYWALPGVELWFFTQLPEFANLTLLRPRAQMLGQTLQADTLHADESISAQSEAYAERLAARLPAVRVINSRRMFCSIDPAAGCTWRAYEQDLLVDGHHFTESGAAWFGQRFLAIGLPGLRK